MYFSIIIPVYNRPDEINELLESLLLTTYKTDFEVVIVEDGSTLSCEDVIQKYTDKLTISYYFKSNSGPGDSRNFGMKKPKVIILSFLIPIALFQVSIYQKLIKN